MAEKKPVGTAGGKRRNRCQQAFGLTRPKCIGGTEDVLPLHHSSRRSGSKVKA
jgi:hypothetical protein